MDLLRSPQALQRLAQTAGNDNGAGDVAVALPPTPSQMGIAIVQELASVGAGAQTKIPRTPPYWEDPDYHNNSLRILPDVNMWVDLAELFGQYAEEGHIQHVSHKLAQNDDPIAKPQQRKGASALLWYAFAL